MVLVTSILFEVDKSVVVVVRLNYAFFGVEMRVNPRDVPRVNPGNG